MTRNGLELPNGQIVALDERGYLLERSGWSPAVAEAMAAADGIALREEHWVMIRLFQEYFDRYEIEPPMRAVVRMARDHLGEDKGSSRFLSRLFPNGPVIQATRYAGLPRPVSCI